MKTKKHVATVYMNRTDDELRNGLKNTLTMGVRAEERGKILEYANRYLKSKDIMELTPETFGL